MKLYATAHAIIRYRERVRPTLGFEESKRELERLLDGCEIVEEAPDWAFLPGAGERWAVLTDDIGCPVAPDGNVTTVVVRGLVPATHRANVNRRKSQRRHAKRLRSQNADKKPRTERPRARIEDEAWPV